MSLVAPPVGGATGAPAVPVRGRDRQRGGRDTRRRERALEGGGGVGQPEAVEARGADGDGDHMTDDDVPRAGRRARRRFEQQHDRGPEGWWWRDVGGTEGPVPACSGQVHHRLSLEWGNLARDQEVQVDEPEQPVTAAPPVVPPVVVSEDGPTIAPVKRAHRSAPRWESEARERVKTALKKFQKPLADLVTRDANEGDTRLLITDVLCDALGFDKYEDLTTEYQVKGEFADYGIRIDKQLVAFIEVKRATTKLGAKHLRQVEMYAVNEGVEWVWLSKGSVWQVYHIEGGLPVVIDLALEVNLLEDSPSQKANALFYLTREALKRKLIDELWLEKRAKSPKSLARPWFRSLSATPSARSFAGRRARTSTRPRSCPCSRRRSYGRSA